MLSQLKEEGEVSQTASGAGGREIGSGSHRTGLVPDRYTRGDTN